MNYLEMSLQCISILSSGIVAGNFLVMILAFRPMLRSLPPSNGVQVHQSINPLMNRSIPIFFGLASVAGLAMLATFVFYHHWEALSGVLTVLAVVGLMIVAITSLFVEFPINRTIDSFSMNSVPQEYEALQNRWDKGHVFRTFGGVLAFCCFTLAGLMGAS